jgi:hypothetical protein
MLKAFLFLYLLSGAAKAAAWREDFKDLRRWQPLLFPKIPAHSVYQSVSIPGGTALRCESRASASGLLLKEAYDIKALPVLRFEWKVENIYPGADPRKKSADDYPLRLYVSFPLDPKKAGLLDRLARAIYGQLPPHSSLNYVWSSLPSPRAKPYPSPYTSRVRMIALQGGPENVGKWVTEEVNVLEDYRLAFGKDAPPGLAQLAIMNDSDNTKAAALSWLRYVEAAEK